MITAQHLRDVRIGCREDRSRTPHGHGHAVLVQQRAVDIVQHQHDIAVGQEVGKSRGRRARLRQDPSGQAEFRRRQQDVHTDGPGTALEPKHPVRLDVRMAAVGEVA
jgi:hypothetical protein